MQEKSLFQASTSDPTPQVVLIEDVVENLLKSKVEAINFASSDMRRIDKKTLNSKTD